MWIVTDGNHWFGPFQSETYASRYGYFKWKDTGMVWEVIRIYRPANLKKKFDTQCLSRKERDDHKLAGRVT